MDHNNILAVVLAGGKSKRFGRDKSQVKLGNKILIDYVLTEIVDYYKEILIVTNESIKYLNSDKIYLTSDIKKDLGPLGGVFSAMKWVRDNKKDYKWISTFPIDTPFFKKDHLTKFYKEISLDKSNLFFMKSKNTRHNIFGLWSLELFEKLTESQKTLKSILEETKNIQSDIDRVNSLKEISDEIESVINQLKTISEEE